MSIGRGLGTGLALALAAMAAHAPLSAEDGDVVLAADTTGTPAERAAQMVAQLTREEKLTLVKGYFGGDFPPTEYVAHPDAIDGSAGFVPGIPRLGIPPQWETDAGLGVASQGTAKIKRPRTALPSGLATAATWDVELANQGGRMIGSEARADGFNVMLGGSVNLLREPRNGRNFEYAGEDPLLAGRMVGAQIAGVQANGIISTIKHYAVNDQETERGVANFLLEEDDLRMSDLLAFQFAFESGNPGSVMCAYNKLNGDYACENRFLLTQVLREEWDWPGYVMSDWGAVHSTAKAANAGLDQESGFGLQRDDHFGDKLAEAVATGEVSEERLRLMVTRILHAMFDKGVIDNPVVGDESLIDFEANRAIAQADAEAGIVLLKNAGNVLPLAGAKRIAVIGGHADKGVLSGGGSSQVYPDGENAVPGIEPTGWPGPVVWYPSSPLAELRALLPDTEILYADGSDPAAAVRLAQETDLAIVFGTQWSSESIDIPMRLDGEQDALIAAIAAASGDTVVVLETGGPVAMPWVDDVEAIVEAWYPGRMGGAAIANVLAGMVNPSGHLPATFPVALDQMPWAGEVRRGHVTYEEGATVGYKWFDARGIEPLFPFGHGLSYTSFAHRGLTARARGDGIAVKLTVTNTGEIAGGDVVQIYVSAPWAGWEAPQRLGAFAKVQLEPGESRNVELEIDPRLLARWDLAKPGWQRKAGSYTVTVGTSSRALGESVQVDLDTLHLGPGWKPGG